MKIALLTDNPGIGRQIALAAEAMVVRDVGFIHLDNRSRLDDVAQQVKETVRAGGFAFIPILMGDATTDREGPFEYSEVTRRLGRLKGRDTNLVIYRGPHQPRISGRWTGRIITLDLDRPREAVLAMREETEK